MLKDHFSQTQTMEKKHSALVIFSLTVTLCLISGGLAMKPNVTNIQSGWTQEMFSREFFTLMSSGKYLYTERLAQHLRNTSSGPKITMQCMWDVLRLIDDIRNGEYYALRG